MKRKTTKEILAESLQELAAVKNIEKITIREIVENCGYSPATFYRHFKDKYDLIAWDYAEKFKLLSKPVGMDGCRWEDVLPDSARYHYQHRDYLANLLQHTRGMYSFEQYMTQLNYDFLLDLIKDKVPKKEQKKVERCLMVYCIGGVRYNMEWLLGKFEATPEEMSEVYRDTIPEIVYQYMK